PRNAHDVVLCGTGILSITNIADAHPGAANGLKRHVIQLRHVVDQTVGVDVIVVRPHFDVACRQNEVLIVHGVYDIHHAEIPRKELEWIDMDHDLPIFTTEG